MTILPLCIQNEKALTDGEISEGQQGLYKEADKYCRVILGRLSRGWGCVKGMALIVIAIGVAVAFTPPTALESLDLTKIPSMLNIHYST